MKNELDPIYTDTMRSMDARDFLASLKKPTKKVKRRTAWNSTIKISKKKRTGLKRAKMKKKRILLVPLPKLIKKADVVFSLWIRNRDKFKCVTCGSIANPQCGHLIKRGKKTTRYDEKNCNCQCSGCNYLHNQYPEVYTNWFIDKYGVQEYKDMCNRATYFHKWTREELYEIIKKYESRKQV